MPYRVEPRREACRQPGPDARSMWNRFLVWEFNVDLDRKAYPWSLNEPFLTAQLERLDAMTSIPEAGYWLSLARLTELALLCAGHYADLNELEAAGDLLVNPLCILVHLPDRAEPVQKQRHGRLSDQFAGRANSRAGVRKWLQTRTLVQVEQQPLLPLLCERLRGSGKIRESYLDSIALRMQRIAEVIGLLASWHIPEKLTIYEYLLQAAQPDRDFVESNLCRFDTGLFDRLGQELDQWMVGAPAFPSEFVADSFLD